MALARFAGYERRVARSLIGFAIALGACSSNCPGDVDCVGPVTITADVRALPRLPDRVKVCTNGECQESPGNAAVYQGPGPARVGSAVDVSVDFIDAAGVSMIELVGAGTVKDLGCCNGARFVADFGRNRLTPA